MKITIRYRAFVQADVPISIDPVESVDHKALLDWIFRQFNRVDDNELIHILGLQLPSLSVGDEVEIDNNIYRCEMIGWRKL